MGANMEKLSNATGLLALAGILWMLSPEIKKFCRFLGVKWRNRSGSRMAEHIATVRKNSPVRTVERRDGRVQGRKTTFQKVRQVRKYY